MDDCSRGFTSRTYEGHKTVIASPGAQGQSYDALQVERGCQYLNVCYQTHWNVNHGHFRQQTLAPRASHTWYKMQGCVDHGGR